MSTSAENVKEQLLEVAEMPRQFFKDGVQFINRCKKPDQKGRTLMRNRFQCLTVKANPHRIPENRPSRCHGLCSSWSTGILCQGKKKKRRFLYANVERSLMECCS